MTQSVVNREEAIASAPELWVCGIKMNPVVVTTGSYSAQFAFTGAYSLSVGPVRVEIKRDDWASTFCATVQMHHMAKFSSRLADAYAAAVWASQSLVGMMRESDRALAKIREWSDPKEEEHL